MGFGTRFCRNIAKRSYQYAVRSTYDLFTPSKSTRKGNSKSGYSVSYTCGTNYGGSTRQKKVKVEEPVYFKTGERCYGDERYVEFKGYIYDVDFIKGKMITFKDGTRHRISSCEYIDKDDYFLLRE